MLGRVQRFFRDDADDELMAYYAVIAEYALSFDTRSPASRSSSDPLQDSGRIHALAGTGRYPAVASRSTSGERIANEVETGSTRVEAGGVWLDPRP